MRPENSIGDRIAAYRTARWLTQRQLAASAHVSLSLLRKVEQGSRPVTDRTLEAIADALGAEPDVLAGRRRVTDSRVHAAVPSIRMAIAAYDLPEDGPVRPLVQLQQAVGEATGWRLGSQYTRLAESLPVLLGELTRCRHGDGIDQRATGARLLVSAYRAADAVAYKYGYYDLSARLVELMRASAEVADDTAIREVMQLFSLCVRELEPDALAGEAATVQPSWTNAAFAVGERRDDRESESPLLKVRNGDLGIDDVTVVGVAVRNDGAVGTGGADGLGEAGCDQFNLVAGIGNFAEHRGTCASDNPKLTLTIGVNHGIGAQLADYRLQFPHDFVLQVAAHLAAPQLAKVGRADAAFERPDRDGHRCALTEGLQAFEFDAAGARCCSAVPGGLRRGRAVALVHGCSLRSWLSSRPPPTIAPLPVANPGPRRSL